MPEAGKTPEIFRFGPFELSVETGELRKHGVRLPLAGQPIEVLALLVKSPGRLVPREELQRRLWPGSVSGDFETGLNAAVNRLRDRLGDSATDPKYIETVPGRGYRFIARVPGSNDGVGPGKTVSHYRILEIIGRGGMGVAYRAQDLTLGRHVAVMFLLGESANNPEELARFWREACVASSLNHPNICTIYEIAEHEGQPFIVMELLQGQSLREYLIASALRRSRLDPVLDLDELLDISLQILSGLQAAHENGILHRDIKPTNIFITNGRLVKILDFGLAKLIRASTSELETFAIPTEMGSESPPSNANATVGSVLGSAAYMSPEQARGEDLDIRNDLFSFGAVLYEMATGRSAFNGTTTAELCEAILTKTPVPVHELNPSVPPTLERVINKALDKNREQRYQSATELRAELIKVQQAAQPEKASAPDWPITQQETRFLEAAAPKEATVGRSIEVMTMVRENESTGGLREFLRTEETPQITPEDVRERSFDVEFPLDEEAKPQPLDITLRLESPGFDPQRQIKKLRVPPRGDSPACTFFIIPRVVGELVINLELLNIQEQVLASRSIRTNALPAGAETSSDKVVLIIPLTLVVTRIGDRILEMAPVAAKDSCQFDTESSIRAFETDLASNMPAKSSEQVIASPEAFTMFGGNRDSGVPTEPNKKDKERRSGAHPVSQVGGEESSKSGDLTGKTFSHYRILEITRQGGFGMVYKAEDVNTGRLVFLHLLGKKPDDPWVQRIESGEGEIREHEGQRFAVQELDGLWWGSSAGLPHASRAQVGRSQIFDDAVLSRGDLIGKNFSHYRLLGVVRWDRHSATYEAEDLKSHVKVELRFLLHPEQHEYHASEVHEHEGVGFVVRERSINKISGKSNKRSPKRHIFLLVVTAILGLMIGGVVFLPHRFSPFLKPNGADTIVLADFTNFTQIPELGRGPGPFYDEYQANVQLWDAMRSALKLPPTVKVLSADRVDKALQQMNRKPNEPLTPDLAREVCRRENCKGVLSRSVKLEAKVYRIDASVTDCRNGVMLAIAKGEASNPEDVPKVLKEVTGQLLGQLRASKP